MILYGAGDPAASVRTLGRHIRHVHIKDATASDNPGLDWGKSTAVGAGGVNFVELLAALAEVGYTGPLAIEQESSRRGEENVRAAITYLQSLS
jgi:sugar phosphate isomerase/epimerase